VDLSQYRGLFLEEARRHLGSTESLLAGDTLDEADLASLERVFQRLKGMAATMSLPAVSLLSQSLERFVTEAKNGVFRLNEDAIELIGEGVEFLHLQLGAVEELRDPLPADEFEDRLRTWTITGSVNSFTVVEDTGDAATDLRLPTPVREAPDDVMLAFAQALAACRAIRRACPEAGREAFTRFDASLQVLWDSVLALKTVPLHQIAPALQRQVLAAARRYQRKVLLEVEGGDSRVSQTLLGHLQPALANTLRHIISRSFESDAERIALGKGPTCSLKLRARPAGNTFVIEIEDDGHGRPEARSEFDNAGEEPSLVAEFTDEHTPTRRGRGLAQARQVFDSLGCRVRITSVPGRGTSWNIEAPLPAQLLDVVEVEAGGHVLAVPCYLLEDPPGGSDARAPSLLGLPVTGRTALRTRDGDTFRIDVLHVASPAVVLQAPYPLHRVQSMAGVIVGADGSLVFVVRPMAG
jgi:hypothetical protein